MSEKTKPDEKDLGKVSGGSTDTFVRPKQPVRITPDKVRKETNGGAVPAGTPEAADNGII